MVDFCCKNRKKNLNNQIKRKKLSPILYASIFTLTYMKSLLFYLHYLHSPLNKQSIRTLRQCKYSVSSVSKNIGQITARTAIGNDDRAAKTPTGRQQTNERRRQTDSSTPWSYHFHAMELPSPWHGTNSLPTPFTVVAAPEVVLSRHDLPVLSNVFTYTTYTVLTLL